LGGRFSVIMSVIGAVIIQAMNTGILVSGFPPQFNLVVKAGVIIAILIVQSEKLKTLFFVFRNADAKSGEIKP
jgi:galactofuranose transport system permease protein